MNKHGKKESLCTEVPTEVSLWLLSSFWYSVGPLWAFFVSGKRSFTVLSTKMAYFSLINVGSSFHCRIHSRTRSIYTRCFNTVSGGMRSCRVDQQPWLGWPNAPEGKTIGEVEKLVGRECMCLKLTPRLESFIRGCCFIWRDDNYFWEIKEAGRDSILLCFLDGEMYRAKDMNTAPRSALKICYKWIHLDQFGRCDL
jgi:hypothetical protein